MMLKAIAIGRLCKDPDLRYTPGGKAVASIRLACDRNRAKNETDFITVICWEKQAETIANNLQGGRLIFVEGQLQIRSWEDRDGQRRETPEIHASTIKFLDYKPKDPSADPLNGLGREVQDTEAPVTA